MKNSIDIIGNRTRDLPACSTVPEYGNYIPSSIFLLCFFLSKKFVFLGSAAISDRNCGIPEDKGFVGYV
jgi:hypothetical protein